MLQTVEERQAARYRQMEQEARERQAREQQTLDDLGRRMARAFSAEELAYLARTPMDGPAPAEAVVSRAQAIHAHRAALEEELRLAEETIEKEQPRAEAHGSTVKRLKRQRPEDVHAHDLRISKEIALRDEAAAAVRDNRARIAAIQDELARIPGTA